METKKTTKSRVQWTPVVTNLFSVLNVLYRELGGGGGGGGVVGHSKVNAMNAPLVSSALFYSPGLQFFAVIHR